MLVYTDRNAQGELSHEVQQWMGTPEKEGSAAAAAAAEAAEAERPSSPMSRLANKLSPVRCRSASPGPLA